MDVFDLRERVTGQYSAYVRSFHQIRNPDTKRWVDGYIAAGKLWPEPLVQLNPSFQPRATVEALVKEGLLHETCADIFRHKKQEQDGSVVIGPSVRLYRHQDEATRIAQTGASYVLTTGTGSGKSMAYFLPITDRVLRDGPGKGKIRAIIVYPMNSLANSQVEQIGRFINLGFPEGHPPISVRRYTGQESKAEREEIAQNPPDVLLTNYVMLELILTRTTEQWLVKAAEGLRYLVLDELHTYRGRQGADVAMLVRRVRERVGAPNLQCVGTSATIAGEGTREERQKDIAELATRLFGQEVRPEHVIGETLQRACDRPEPDNEELSAALSANADAYPDGDFDAFAADPLAAWAEQAFGLKLDEKGRLERRPARTISDAAAELAERTGIAAETCAARLRAVLMGGYRTIHPVTGLPVFAFRLHQWIGRGDRVFTTAEDPEHRWLTGEEQRFAPGEVERRLFPLAFCRECGAEYLVVLYNRTEGTLLPRELSEESSDDAVEDGFVLLDPEHVMDKIDLAQLVEEWVEYGPNGELREKRDKRNRIPKLKAITPDGRVLEPEAAPEEAATWGWWFPAPFQYCLECRVTYPSARESDFAKLSELSTEGRSTATTVLTVATVSALKEDGTLSKEAQKLLSFTDNRQDASLQSGHLNDFVQVSLLRSALLLAVREAGAGGLRHNLVAQQVTEKLGLPLDEYASNPNAKYGTMRATDDALRSVVGYLLYNDLRRGWRVNAPNLEQVGLLSIDYEDLADICADDDIWSKRHAFLAKATSEERQKVAHAVLDWMRRELAIKVRFLDRSQQTQITDDSFQYLKDPWAFERDQKLWTALPLALQRNPGGWDKRPVLSPSSLLGRYLRRGTTWPSSRAFAESLKPAELGVLARDLLDGLADGGLVERSGDEDAPQYMLQAGAMLWKEGPGYPPEDPVRAPGKGGADRSPNPYFRRFYETAATVLHGLHAHEHTAQVTQSDRIEREDDFRNGRLPIMFCSPTMELGVDISDLNAVHLRNVPPTPANYAQRSGRAGRSGQPALVLQYCTNYSPHDSYYFKRPKEMVSGAVQPPRLDLLNEDLLRAHIHAIWLAETNQSLYASIAELLQLDDLEHLPLTDGVEASLKNAEARKRAEKRARAVLAGLEPALKGTTWYTVTWLSEVMNSAYQSFNQAIDRWRSLYRAAEEQSERQHKVIHNPTAMTVEKQAAKRLRDEAEQQVRLLVATTGTDQSDFYSYRFMASSGFLPGYSFPRLPLSAYIPGRSEATDRGHYLQRPRFLALSEFGPRSIIYHEGQRYRVVRAIFSTQDADRELGEAKICGACGYGHFGEAAAADTCQRCNATLSGDEVYLFTKLLRLTNVATRAVDRITSDEEERLRLGYDIRVAFRFDDKGGTPRKRQVQFVKPPANGSTDTLTVATGTYAPAATLWRINIGWLARRRREPFGFPIDLDSGKWTTSKHEQGADPAVDDPDNPNPKRARIETVVPYVQDRRNALVISLDGVEDQDTQASVLYALKRGIETEFQLEDSELAVEPLPSPDKRRHMLFYEAAEGGAGVLQRLADEPDALPRVARKALEILHFDTLSGLDVGRIDGEPCVRACYDCLLSYANQRFHEQLSRHAAREVLLELAASRAETGSGDATRGEQYRRLDGLSGSELERRFLKFLYEHGYTLPDSAQLKVEEARPDFFYEADQVCVYVDGPIHDYPDRADRDALVRGALRRAGFTIVRIQADPQNWEAELAKYAYVFGTGYGVAPV